MDTDRVETGERNYIKPYVIFNFGKEVATVMAKAYAASSASEKLESIPEMMKLPLKDEAKIKYIGDVMTRPRKERMAISRKLTKLVEESNE